MAEIRQAIDQRDGARLQQAAHYLKGSVGNLGARQAFEAAGRLEPDGREQDWGERRRTGPRWKQAISRLEPAFAELGPASAAMAVAERGSGDRERG